MAYATFQDVQTRVTRNQLDDVTKVTETDVDLFIEDVCGEVDAVLVNLGYVVPVEEPTWFLNRLRSLTSDGAAAITLRALYPEATGPGETPAYSYFEKRYRNGLKQLVDGAHPKKAELTSASTFFTNHPKDDRPLFHVQRQY